MRPEKTIRVANKDVRVKTERHAGHRFKVTATAPDGTTAEVRLTLGPANGPGASGGLSKQQLQRAVDRAREKAANTAAYRSQVAELESEID